MTKVISKHRFAIVLLFSIVSIFFFTQLHVSQSGLSFKTQEALAAPQGVWGIYYDDEWAGGAAVGKGIKYTVVENIDFPDLNATIDARMPGQEKDPVTGRIRNIRLDWSGAIYMPFDGDYGFRVDVPEEDDNNDLRFAGSSSKGWKRCRVYDADDNGSNCGGDREVTNKYFSQGWYLFEFRMGTFSAPVGSRLQLFWTKPNSACGGNPCPEEPIPTSVLSPKSWADDFVVIPDLSKPQERLDYVAAGVGSDGLSDPTIIIDMPPGPILDDEVLLIYSYARTSNGNVTVTNNNTAVSRTLTPETVSTEYGFKHRARYTKLPPELIGDGGTGKLSLSFDATFSRENGFVLLVPYEDSTQQEGRISIFLGGRHIYRYLSKVFTFPTHSLEIDPNDVRPVFFVGNGETFFTEPDKYRPNYLTMLSGSGIPPKETDWLDDMDLDGIKNEPGEGQIIVPFDTSLTIPADPSNTEAFYPAYGREGKWYDVISSNYVPNQACPIENFEYNNGVSNNKCTRTGGGLMDKLTLNPDDTWIAFQWASNAFDTDGVDTYPESGTFVGGGVFSNILPFGIYPPPPISPTVDLKVDGSDGPVTYNNGEIYNLEWTTGNNPDACNATNSWQGLKDPTGGSEPHSTTTSDSFTYKLDCFSGPPTSNPERVGFIDVDDSSFNIAIKGDYLYSTGGDDSNLNVDLDFEVFDISNPVEPKFVTGINLGPISTIPIAIKGNTAYVGGFTSVAEGRKFFAIDITDPLNPNVIATAPISSNGGHSLAMEGDYAYLVGAGGLYIFDVSNPFANPIPEVKHISQANLDGLVLNRGGVGIKDGIMFLAGQAASNDFRVYDLVNPENPQFIGGVDLSGGDGVEPSAFGHDIEFSDDGNYAFVVMNPPAAVEVIDISSRAYPQWVTSMPIGADGRIAERWNQFLYVTHILGGDDFEIFDITEPTTPIPVGGGQTVARARGITISGPYLYVSTNGVGGANEIEIFSNRATDFVVVDVIGAPDLMAGLPSANELLQEGDLTFSGEIGNNGSIDVVTSPFNNILKIDIGNNGAGGDPADFDENWLIVPTISDLASGASTTVTSSPYFFPIGTHRVKLCADLDASNVGVITEENEDNNCGPEYIFNVVVAGPAPDLIADLPIISPDPGTAGSSIFFDSRVQNIGSVSTGGTDFDNEIRIDFGNNGSVDYVGVKTITQNVGAPTPTRQLDFTWTPERFETGTHSVVICVDSTNAIDEEVEVNNCTSPVIFTVNSPDCDDGADSAGDPDPWADINDPACHSNWDLNDTFNWFDDDETNDRECSDSINNDPLEDSLIDSDDPDCHVNHDIALQYLPSHDDESGPEAELGVSLIPDARVRSGETVTVSWETAYITEDSCTISGTNGQSWTADSGDELTDPITEPVGFTLTCLDLTLNTVTASITVQLLPGFGEF